MPILKIIHMASGSLILLLFAIRSIQLVIAPDFKVTHPIASKVLIGLSHLTLAVLVGCGMWLLVQQIAIGLYVYWIYAKIMLLFVAISAMAKAGRATDPTQVRAGVFLAGIAYSLVICLIMFKPMQEANVASMVQKKMAQAQASELIAPTATPSAP